MTSSTLLAQQLNLNLGKQAKAQDIPYATTSNAFGTMIGNVLSAVMVVAALAVFLFLVWGAIDWITAGGEKGKIESARNKMTGAVIGLVVLASTLALYFVVQNFLGINVITIK